MGCSRNLSVLIALRNQTIIINTSDKSFWGSCTATKQTKGPIIKNDSYFLAFIPGFSFGPIFGNAG